VAFARDSRENSFIARLWATQRVGYLSAEKRRNGGSREIDDEIRELGERYGIPTEFTSYLVLEPGMRPEASLGMRRDRSAVTGQGAAAPPTVATAPAAKAFESARSASEQRAAMNLAEADLAGAAMDASSLRRVGPRVFELRGETWTDTRAADSLKTVRIKAFSDAYFKLIESIPELREAFAVGDKVVVAGRRVKIQLGDSGAESLSESELREITTAW
jgi:hypothetical protein